MWLNGGPIYPPEVPTSAGLRLVQIIGVSNRLLVRARTAQLKADKSESAFAKCVQASAIRAFEFEAGSPQRWPTNISTRHKNGRRP